MATATSFKIGKKGGICLIYHVSLLRV